MDNEYTINNSFKTKEFRLCQEMGLRNLQMRPSLEALEEQRHLECLDESLANRVHLHDPAKFIKILFFKW